MKSIAIALSLASITLLQTPAAQAVRYKVLYSFQGGSDGSSPQGELVLSPGTRNDLVGTTALGGGSDCGGQGCGTAYTINRVNGQESSLPFGDGSAGAQSDAGLTFAPNFGFYGVATAGGQSGVGTIFTTADLRYPVYSFAGGVGDGATPNKTMVLDSSRGALYGTTGSGGVHDAGTIFIYDLHLQIEYLIYSFGSQSNDGQEPIGGLTLYKRKLYGTTTLGGTGYGTVFAVDPATGQETSLHSFNYSGDGATPTGTLLDVNGVLYGTTQLGGQFGSGSSGGTIFAANATNGKTTVYWNFCSQSSCADGSVPMAGLIRDKSTLYGTTFYGGSDTHGTIGAGGTVYSFSLTTGTETVLYNFCSKTNCTDGANPISGLLLSNGKLYGTTSSGGTGTACTGGCGTVFEITR